MKLVRFITKNFLRSSLLVLTLSSCASSSGERWGTDPQLPSHADPASYGADGFSFSKPMPVRGVSKYDFYFKSCALDDGRPYYSKTSYSCSTIP